MPIRMVGKDQDLARIKQELEKEFIDFLLEFYAVVTRTTPVDTGYARVNWLIDFGRIVARLVGTRPNVRGRAPRSGALIAAPTGQLLTTWKIEAGNVFIHNSVDYIVFLDEGSSPQADQGILDPALAATRGLLG